MNGLVGVMGATASASDAYPLERVRPESGARVCVWSRHRACEMQLCAHTPAPGVMRTKLPSSDEGRFAPHPEPSPSDRCGRPLKELAIYCYSFL